MNSIVDVQSIHSYYGESHILRGVSLEIEQAQAVSLLGRNGAGKTTTVLSILGYVRPRHGRVLYRGKDITGQAPFRTTRNGVGFVPQERAIFPSLTVEENLTIAARRQAVGPWNLAAVYRTFPRLEERRRNMGNQLSGGEQQMLAIARALMGNPHVLLMDEPSEGLAPIVVREIVRIIQNLKSAGMSILLVEQNLRVALAVADRHLILNKGEIQFSGTSAEIESNDAVLKAHLSV
jgi:branched-chain amino acid transport system ATP-binding protein